MCSILNIFLTVKATCINQRQSAITMNCNSGGRTEPWKTQHKEEEQLHAIQWAPLFADRLTKYRSTFLQLKRSLLRSWTSNPNLEGIWTSLWTTWTHTKESILTITAYYDWPSPNLMLLLYPKYLLSQDWLSQLHPQ